jgi:hypothetical protein
MFTLAPRSSTTCSGPRSAAGTKTPVLRNGLAQSQYEAWMKALNIHPRINLNM